MLKMPLQQVASFETTIAPATFEPMIALNWKIWHLVKWPPPNHRAFAGFLVLGIAPHMKVELIHRRE